MNILLSTDNTRSFFLSAVPSTQPCQLLLFCQFSLCFHPFKHFLRHVLFQVIDLCQQNGYFLLQCENTNCDKKCVTKTNLRHLKHDLHTIQIFTTCLKRFRNYRWFQVIQRQKIVAYLHD